jgi:hypothetical protein
MMEISIDIFCYEIGMLTLLNSQSLSIGIDVVVPGHLKRMAVG